ncbi:MULTISPECIES: LuxR C-terminal-related transcriptional regulator [unclassified Nostoc]|uniref:helix-turn-helix transcriptional regulator n=1 Tax=unclassified Nostoc TaxID=2593658 RepID=UPI002AD53E5A|nr:LuxR C-terminal-related transcriptional regulator [Nostoc sp. DedQUE03]MDZ7977180.1 LuxR C-terminal-related transcriptional regulator [Nostoc sp. DedQUE03]MDZ8044034.1 LuxR C-terminal-related transcriptional regulator [Nostoc sp. DedQUE02]
MSNCSILGYNLLRIGQEALTNAIKYAHTTEIQVELVYEEMQCCLRISAKLIQRMNHPELSQRELKVLQLVAQGMSNLEIGTTLNVSESTVKSNINRILSKLGAKDRTQATIIALRADS